MTVPVCILAWGFLVLAIMLFACGCVGCCRAASEGRARSRQGGDVEMQSIDELFARTADDLPPPPPPTKSWSPEERRALARAVSGLPPSCLPDVRSIVGGDESDALFRLRWPAALHSVDYASLDVSVCDRVQQYVDAQPSRDSLAGLSGLAFICVGPAFYGFWFFAIRCAFSTI